MSCPIGCFIGANHDRTGPGGMVLRDELLAGSLHGLVVGKFELRSSVERDAVLLGDTQ